ncbi:hypothetical protein NPIL_484931 [Nephila pilipes]|uniref:Uncharacterized protein n=1 Tax=Nephila pilipes TaxID=299642 RepID=A0A8X6U6C0_NEPPI|nr:hypothetical protein NPIL_484931 [Nephila pilipes]
MAHGELNAPILELVTSLLEKSYISFYRERGPTFRSFDSLIPLLTAISSRWMSVYTTSVDIKLEGRVICTPLIALPYAKGNRTLLGIDFLPKSGIVLNLKHRNWFFRDSSHRTYDFC